MTTEEINNINVFFAEFLGYTYYPNENNNYGVDNYGWMRTKHYLDKMRTLSVRKLYNPTTVNLGSYNFIGYNYHRSLLFHKRYNWLLPVVRKCYDLNMECGLLDYIFDIEKLYIETYLYLKNEQSRENC